MKLTDTNPLDYIGTAVFTITMITGAIGVYADNHSVDALIVLLAMGVCLAAAALVLIRRIYRDISRIDARQSAWEEDRRAHDLIVHGHLEDLHKGNQ